MDYTYYAQIFSPCSVLWKLLCALSGSRKSCKLGNPTLKNNWCHHIWFFEQAHSGVALFETEKFIIGE